MSQITAAGKMDEIQALAFIAMVEGREVSRDQNIQGDSLEFLHLVNQLEVGCGRCFDNREIQACKTYGDLARVTAL